MLNFPCKQVREFGLYQHGILHLFWSPFLISSSLWNVVNCERRLYMLITFESLRIRKDSGKADKWHCYWC